MTKFMDEDSRRATAEAVLGGKLPPGEEDARRTKRKILSSRRHRDREKEMKRLRKEQGAEVLCSRGDIAFGPDAINWWV